MNMALAHTGATRIEALRARIAAIERRGQGHAGAATLPFGVETIDRHLPPGGLLLGAMHELQAAGPDVEYGAAPALFAAGILARHPGPVVWIGRGNCVFGHGLLRAGLDPRRIVFVDAGRTGLLAMEEALRHPDVGGVVCELDGRLELVASRRLQLAAEGSRTLGLLIRRSRRFDDPALSQPPAAVTRWRIATLPSSPALAHAPDVPGLGRPRWQLGLMRCRGGLPRNWIVESPEQDLGIDFARIVA